MVQDKEIIESFQVLNNEMSIPAYFPLVALFFLIALLTKKTYNHIKQKV